MGKFRIKIEKLAQNHIEKFYKAGNKGNIKKIENDYKHTFYSRYIIKKIYFV